MTRLLAVLAAIGMIAGAFVYRYGVPGSGSDGDGGGGNEGGRDVAAGKIVCASELGTAVCEAADADVIESTTETADRLIAVRSASDAEIAGWLAPGPWAAMVDDARRRASLPALFAKSGKGLASAPLVVVTRKGQPVSGCPAEITWRCVGDAAQQPAFRLGAEGAPAPRLFIRAAALNGLLGRTDWATNDLDLPSAEGEPDPRSWIGAVDDRFGQAAGFGARSLDTFVLQQGSAAAFLTTGAAATGAPTASFDVRTPSPAVSIAVTYTEAARNGRDLETGPAADALGASGWKVQSNAATQGLPSPGVLLALRST